jgi:hypothetical protein
MVVGVVMLLPLLVNGYCCWLMATTDVATRNGHDHQDFKQFFIDDLKKQCATTTKVSKELG